MQWGLFKIRNEHNETQEQLANLINRDISTYRAKEKGKNQFSGDEMFVIARHYNVRIEDIFLPTKSTKSELTESK